MFARQWVAGLAEFLEHQLLLVLGDANAGIDHRNRHILCVRLRLELHAATLRRELDRVLQQVLQDLLQFGNVLTQTGNVGFDLAAQVGVLLFRERAEHVEQAFADVMQVE